MELVFLFFLLHLSLISKASLLEIYGGINAPAQKMQQASKRKNSRQQVSSPCLKVSGARTVLDIGVFTGASSLASALAVGEHGKVYALEKSKTYAAIARYMASHSRDQEEI